MIQVKDVWKAFGSDVILRGVTFSLKRGEFVGMVGPSGGGKSVLLKLMGNVIPPSSGEFVWEDKGQNENPLHVGFLFQEGALFDSMSVLENVAFPLLSCGRTDSIDAGSGSYRDRALKQAYEMLLEVGLGHAVSKLPGQLSGGMRRRVGIARALVSKPELVLLDDPTGGLDPVAASVIMNLIRKLHADYKLTVVMVSHDIRRLLPRVDRVLGLFDGVIQCDLHPRELQDKAPTAVLEFLKTRFDFAEFHNASSLPSSHPSTSSSERL